MTKKKIRKNLGLTESQLNVMEVFHRRNLRFLLYQLDDEFCMQPVPEAYWHHLGYYLIELLKASDAKAFEMVCQGILHSMLKGQALEDPYLASSIAAAGITENKLFRQILELIRNESEQDGTVPFGSEALGKGPVYSTLWVLHILHLADRTKDHTSLVEPALDYMEKHLDEILDDTPVVPARLMVASLNLNPEGGRALAEKCLNNLLERQGQNHRWDASPLGLAVDGEVVDALLQAALVLGVDAGGAAERWFDAAYGLSRSGDLPEWPELFMECKESGRPDLWIESWLKATLPLARYLSHQRPDHNPAAYLLGASIPQENMLVRAEQMISLAHPYLPSLDDLQAKAGHMRTFWEAGSAPYDKNVYFMCDTAESERRDEVKKVILEALGKHGLVGRQVTEGAVPYLSDPWENAGLFMTGCKHGVALFDRLPDPNGASAPQGPPAPELMYQVGFMRGQGMPLLVLWDEKTITDEGFSIPGVQVPMSQITPKSFDSSENDLAGLREAVAAWAASLAEQPKMED